MNREEKIPDSAFDVDEMLDEIARNELGVETLKIRNSDSLDFYDISVWSIKKALESAFNAGKSIKDDTIVAEWK